MHSTISNLSSYALIISDHVSGMLAYWDSDLLCRFANPAYLDWFGKTREELIDKMTIRELLGPLYELNLEYIQGALSGEIQTFQREIKTPTGEIRYSLANYFPDIVDGEIKGFIAHVVDITPVKKLKNELKQSNEIINEQIDILINFANTISHNLANYSQNFSTISRLLLEEESKESQDELKHLLKVYTDNFRETIKDLNKVISIQKISKLYLSEINLHHYISRIISTLQLQIESTNTTIINNVSTSINVLGIPAYIESILFNFLSNAIKYKHPERPPHIELNYKTHNNHVILSIKDNGQGINLSKYGEDLFGLNKIFHGNTDAVGIGLYITKYQIESIGGSVAVESEEHVGTTFHITLKGDSLLE